MPNVSSYIRIEDNSTPVVVLVSSQHGGLGVIRSLGRAGIPVYGIHEHSWEPAARSRFLRKVFCWNFLTSPAADSVTFLMDVANTISRRPILIPTSDITALFLAENARSLAENFIFSTASVDVVRNFSSKVQTSDLCGEMGIPTAATAKPQSREDVLNFAQMSRFPVIVKGEYGEFLRKRGERVRVATISGKEELLAIFDLNTGATPFPIVLQEYIPGGDDTVWMFNGYFNGRSECLFGATGRKLRQFPPHRGSTSLGICEKSEVVELQTARLLRGVGYCGPVDMGYRYDVRDDQYKLLDVNPRVGSTFRLFVASNGLDVVRALYLDLSGQTVPPAQVCQGRKWIVESNDLVSSWAAFRERQLTFRGWLRSLRGVQEGVWLAWSDLVPLMTLPLLWLRKRLRKRTLRVASGVIKDLAG